jgi:hypothetical protein
MLTPEEFSALMAIIQRAPMTAAEIPTIRAIMAKLDPAKVPPAE